MAVPVGTYEQGVQRAMVLSGTLREAPPVPGFRGKVHLQSAPLGQTYADSCRSARELASSGASRISMRDATTMLLRGHRQRLDLQDLHSRQDGIDGMRVLLSARAASASMMRDAERTLRRPEVVNAGFDPGGPPLGRSPRINPATMEPAGAPSVCQKLDEAREASYKYERFAAIRNEEWPSAIRR
mmetsp:Transcript_27260/g.75897  ORF Transcript_27260/g.75897 Transcript_27260/m.75897 type:complete len:185 (+) Transcript_27260:65-619(+)